MADVLSPPAPSSTSPPSDPSESPAKNDGLPPLSTSSRPRPRERPSSYGHDRMSTLSQHSRTPRSRPVSNITASTAFSPGIAFTVIRDFAYPDYHPMHFGPPPDSQSEPATPSSEWTGSRPLSDPADISVKGSYAVGGNWSAGSWGGDGGVYLKADPNAADHDPESLPRTSFGESEEESTGEESGSAQRKQHRKSRSFANMADYERGRKRDSTYNRHHRETDDYGGGGSFGGQQTDPAGRDTLRQSRSYGYNGPISAENGNLRRNSHQQMLLSNRTYGSSSSSSSSNNNAAHHDDVAHDHPLLPADHDNTIDYDNDMPLDAEVTHVAHLTSPQRQSTCPEDEELFAGRSLALYDFVPQNTNELPLREGQVIWISYRHGNGWLVGEDPATGEQGLVPEAYVRLLSELPHYDEATGRFIELEEDGEQDVSEQVTDSGLVDVTNAASKGVEDLRVDEGYTAT